MKKKKESLEYLPMTGVKTDLKRFMNKYLEYNTVRYEQFVEVWRDRNMVYLCAGRASDREAREFVEKVLLIAQEYFLPPYQFQVRVAGLYLLYAIYQIQPLSPKVKIRLTSGQWQDSMLFQQQAAQQNHLDVVYVFQRLLQEQAFLFCYTASEMSINSAIKETEEMGEDLADRLKEEKTAVTSLFNYESLEKLSYIQDQYQQMKIGLAGAQATRPDKSLDVVLTDLVEDVVVLLQSFKEKVSSFSRQGQRPEATNDQEPVTETTGSRRQMLKSQAYSQPRSRTNNSHLTIGSISRSPAKRTISGSGEAGHVAHTDKLSPVPVSTQRPVISPGLQDVTDSSQSEDDSDQDYVPPPKPNPCRRMRPETKHKHQSPIKQQAVAEISPHVEGRADQEDLLMSMPTIFDQDAETALSARRVTQCLQNLRREILTEHNSGTEEPVQSNQPGKKRGRPRKWSGLTEDACKTPNKKHAGQENYSHASPAASSQEQDVSQHSPSVKNRAAFKCKKAEKKAEETTTLGQETKTQPKRRGRPPKRGLSDKLEVARVAESSVDTSSTESSKERTAKFEWVVFPTGRFTSVLHETFCSAHLAQASNAAMESGSRSQTVQHVTSKVRQTQDFSEIEAQACEIPNQQNRRVRKKCAASDSVTLTEIVVGKEKGKPAVIQSQKVHTRVIDSCLPSPKTGATPTTPEQTLDRQVFSEKRTSGATPATVETDSPEDSQPSQPVKVLSQKDRANDCLNSPKEQCKRRLEVDKEPVVQPFKRSRAEGWKPAATTQRRTEGWKPAATTQRRTEGWKPAATTQRRAAVSGDTQQNTVATARTSHKSGTAEAGSVEESQYSQPVKHVKKYSTKHSLQQLKKQCQGQLKERDHESVSHFVKRFMSEERSVELLKSLPNTQQTSAVLREPSVKSHLNSELCVKSAQQAVVLREPSLNKIQQKIAMLRKPSGKSQQNSETSVKSHHNNIVLRHMLSGQPVAVHQLPAAGPPHQMIQDQSPHKSFAAKDTKVGSRDILPPWTSKRRSSLTSPKHKFCPKIKEKTLDPSTVQFRFL